MMAGKPVTSAAPKAPLVVFRKSRRSEELAGVFMYLLTYHSAIQNGRNRRFCEVEMWEPKQKSRPGGQHAAENGGPLCAYFSFRSILVSLRPSNWLSVFEPLETPFNCARSS